MSDISFFRHSSFRKAQPKTVEHMQPRLAERTTGCRALLAYWNSMRHDLSLPKRTDIDPRQISRQLSCTFILEQIAPGLARFRVAGAQLNDLLGMDVRGMPLSALILPEGREDLSTGLQRAFEEPGILRAKLISPGGFRRPELQAELLILPLLDDKGKVTRAIGCLEAQGTIGHTPRRFKFKHLRVDPISVVKPSVAPAVTPRRRDASQRLASRKHLAQAAPRYAPLKPGQPSYLRLVLQD